MLAKILVDNISNAPYRNEWGLSVYIEHSDKKILLDAGSSFAFRNNALNMNVDLKEVDFGVLSHAHYDHANGMPHFFNMNNHAKFYLSDKCKENCYGTRWIFSKYIGIRRGLIEYYSDRIEYISKKTELCDGVYILPQCKGDFTETAKKAGLYIKEKGKRTPDCFSHEQSLVIKTEKGLVILNSCSHAGVDNIIAQVKEEFPDEKIYAYIGGFHLYRSQEAEVRALAERIKESGIEKIYTGHCTGEAAFTILKQELGDSAHQLYVGMNIEI